MTNEQEAIALGNNRTLLLKRLKEAKAVLVGPANRLFGRARFDFAGKRLLGANGLYLQWQVRPKPDEPEGYRNQQTNRGTVTLMLWRGPGGP